MVNRNIEKEKEYLQKTSELVQYSKILFNKKKEKYIQMNNKMIEYDQQ